MTFKDTPDGQTHFYNDGCGEPEHNNMITSPREEEKMMEEWSKSDIAKRVRWVNDLAEQRGCEKWTGQTIPEWWLEKVAQARQEEQDQIEARLKEWIKEKQHRCSELQPDCANSVLSDYTCPFHNSALSDLLAALPTIIRNTPEHE